MLIGSIRLSVIIFILLYLAASASAQCPVMPSGFLCISQEAGNKAAENARLVPALEAKVKVVEEEVAAKDKTIAELKEVNRQNVQDLQGQIDKATAAAAFDRGRAEQCIADKVLWSAIIPVLVQNTRQKTNGIKVF